jgi:hypothetical protein
MAAANFSCCTMISNSAFVAAYRYSVPIATSARSAIRCVVTALTPRPANSWRAAAMMCSRLARSQRPTGTQPRPTATSLDKNYELSHN